MGLKIFFLPKIGYTGTPKYVNIKKYYFILTRFSNLDRFVDSTRFNINCSLAD